MSAAKPSEHLSHWYHHISGLEQSANAFYDAVTRALSEHNLKDTKAELRISAIADTRFTLIADTVSR
jgi:hypothetical protein